TQLAAKADQTAMTTALNAKADTATVNTQLAAKADQTAMTTALNAKADTATVNTQLAAKADQTSVDTAMQSALKFNTSKLVWAANHTYEIGEVARFEFTGDLYVAIKAISGSGNSAPSIDTEHWAFLLNGNPTANTNKKVIFTTQSTHTGALGGINGAHAICQQEADASDHAPAGTYKALLSIGGSHARDVISNSYSYHKVDGTMVADKGIINIFSVSNLLSPLNMNAQGQTVSGPVWTNTKSTGYVDNYSACYGFTGAFQNDPYSFNGPKVGDSSDITFSGWFSKTNQNCSLSARLYCVQQ
ncbi:DUF1554 domain-containing protein, partial [Pseudoalteromonas luteoviolacea]|uniref:DUF1554 domain-containing protein n=1 Tax=Pseudoalteromonas luteoviolacea TaxID=43657 RepID=UPI00114729C4